MTGAREKVVRVKVASAKGVSAAAGAKAASVKAARGSGAKKMATARESAKKFDESSPWYNILNSVVDPEVGVGIADMGLIYSVYSEKGTVLVTMTLTSMGCPAGPYLTEQIEQALRTNKKVKDVQIEIVWEPPWTMELMKPEIRRMLFGR